MPIASKSAGLSATQLFYTILIKKARNFADGCPQNSRFSKLCGSLCDLVKSHCDFAVDKVSALADNAERGRHARHVYRETERNGRSIGRRVEGMLHHRSGNDRTVLLQFQNDIEREIHARSGRKVAVERHRVDPGIFYGKVAVAGRMRDARTRRSAVQIKQQRIARRTGRTRRRICRQKLRIRCTGSTGRARGAGRSRCTGGARCTSRACSGRARRSRRTGRARHAGRPCRTSRKGNAWEQIALQ